MAESNAPFKIPKAHLDLSSRNRLGSGAFGSVYQATYIGENRPRQVAVKLFNSDCDASWHQECQILLELSNITHYVCKALGWSQVNIDGEEMNALVMELYPDSLERKIDRNGPLPKHEVIRHFRELACGLAEVHSHGHNVSDLKPDNALLDRAGRAILADFGVAKKFSSPDEIRETNSRGGTEPYMPPECFKGNALLVSPAADIWALGITVIQMLEGNRRAPWTGAEVKSQIKAGVKWPECLKHRGARMVIQGDPELTDIIRSCLNPDPRHRISAVTLSERLLALEQQYGRPDDLPEPLLRGGQRIKRPSDANTASEDAENFQVLARIHEASDDIESLSLKASGYSPLTWSLYMLLLLARCVNMITDTWAILALNKAKDVGHMPLIKWLLLACLLAAYVFSLYCMWHKHCCISPAPSRCFKMFDRIMWLLALFPVLWPFFEGFIALSNTKNLWRRMYWSLLLQGILQALPGVFMYMLIIPADRSDVMYPILLACLVASSCVSGAAIFSGLLSFLYKYCLRN